MLEEKKLEPEAGGLHGRASCCSYEKTDKMLPLSEAEDDHYGGRLRRVRLPVPLLFRFFGLGNVTPGTS